MKFPDNIFQSRKEYNKQRILRRRAIAQLFVKALRKETFCEWCGKQPIQWHNKEHKTKMNLSIGRMAAHGESIENIKKEIAKCQALCKSCHCLADRGKTVKGNCLDCGKPTIFAYCETCAPQRAETILSGKNGFVNILEWREYNNGKYPDYTPGWGSGRRKLLKKLEAK